MPRRTALPQQSAPHSAERPEAAPAAASSRGKAGTDIAPRAKAVAEAAPEPASKPGTFPVPPPARPIPKTGLSEDDVQRTDADGNTLLHHTWDVPLAEAVLAKRPDLGAYNNEGETPLHLAVKRGLIPVAELLLSRGADPNAPDFAFETPLHCAVRT
jgi:hypothetical protein